MKLLILLFAMSYLTLPLAGLLYMRVLSERRRLESHIKTYQIARGTHHIRRKRIK